MLITSHRLREGNQVDETQVSARTGLGAEPLPRRAAVGTDVSGSDAPLERLECTPDSMLKLAWRDCIQLLLGVVEIVQVDGGDAEVLAAAVDLVIEVGRGEAMPIDDQLAGRNDPGIDILPLDVRLVLGARGGRRAVEGEVAPLRADDDLVARDFLRRDRFTQRGADGTLRTLAPVVDRRVEDVEAASQRLPDRLRVACVVRVVAFPEIGTGTDRRYREVGGDRPEVIGREAGDEALAVTPRAGAARAPGGEEGSPLLHGRHAVTLRRPARPHKSVPCGRSNDACTSWPNVAAGRPLPCSAGVGSHFRTDYIPMSLGDCRGPPPCARYEMR